MSYICLLIDGTEGPHALRKHPRVIEAPVLIQGVQGLDILFVEIKVKKVTVLFHSYGVITL